MSCLVSYSMLISDCSKQKYSLLVKFMKNNIVAVVIVVTLTFWIPASYVIHRIVSCMKL